MCVTFFYGPFYAKGVLVCMYTVRHIDFKYYNYGMYKESHLS